MDISRIETALAYKEITSTAYRSNVETYNVFQTCIYSLERYFCDSVEYLFLDDLSKLAQFLNEQYIS